MEITLMFPDGTGYTYGIISGTDHIYKIDGLVYLEHKEEEYSDTFYVGLDHPYRMESISYVYSILRDDGITEFFVYYADKEKQRPFAEFVISNGRKHYMPLREFGISED